MTERCKKSSSPPPGWCGSRARHNTSRGLARRSEVPSPVADPARSALDLCLRVPPRDRVRQVLPGNPAGALVRRTVSTWLRSGNEPRQGSSKGTKLSMPPFALLNWFRRRLANGSTDCSDGLLALHRRQGVSAWRPAVAPGGKSSSGSSVHRLGSALLAYCAASKGTFVSLR